MAISAQMSLWGLYQIDATILDGLIVPAGMDGDVFKDNLLLETESLEILYPNTDFLKAAITIWAAERKEVWDKLYATTKLTYNPTENYDRLESGVSTVNATSSGSNETVNANTSFNSDTFKNTGKANSSGSNNANSTNTFSNRIHGNIGVKTASAMITEARDEMQFCITQFMIDDFISRFCVGVY